MGNWEAFLNRPAEFAQKWLGYKDLTRRQRDWLRKIANSDDRRIGLVYPRRYSSELIAVTSIAAIWRGFIHKQHSQMVVSHNAAGLAQLRALGFILSTAKAQVRDHFIYHPAGFVTRDNVAVWRLAKCFPENVATHVQNCDLYIGDFDRIPTDTLIRAFQVKLDGFIVFPTSSGKWPHHM